MVTTEDITFLVCGIVIAASLVVAPRIKWAGDENWRRHQAMLARRLLRVRLEVATQKFAEGLVEFGTVLSALGAHMDAHGLHSESVE